MIVLGIAKTVNHVMQVLNYECELLSTCSQVLTRMLKLAKFIMLISHNTSTSIRLPKSLVHNMTLAPRVLCCRKKCMFLVKMLHVFLMSKIWTVNLIGWKLEMLHSQRQNRNQFSSPVSPLRHTQCNAGASIIL